MKTAIQTNTRGSDLAAVILRNERYRPAHALAYCRKMAAKYDGQVNQVYAEAAEILAEAIARRSKKA